MIRVGANVLPEFGGLPQCTDYHVDFPIIHFYDQTQNVYVPYHPTQVQPKDFDLSLNFQVIKTPALLPQMQKVNPFRRLIGLVGAR